MLRHAPRQRLCQRHALQGRAAHPKANTLRALFEKRKPAHVGRPLKARPWGHRHAHGSALPSLPLMRQRSRGWRLRGCACISTNLPASQAASAVAPEGTPPEPAPSPAAPRAAGAGGEAAARAPRGWRRATAPCAGAGASPAQPRPPAARTSRALHRRGRRMGGRSQRVPARAHGHVGRCGAAGVAPVGGLVPRCRGATTQGSAGPAGRRLF